MKKALLVGINKYHDAPLRGCVNDCILMYKMLKQKFGFDALDMLLDEQATKKNIISRIRSTFQGCKEGDTVFFHYSGHGSQVVVDDYTLSTETDGRDEILCPVDLDWNDPLRDHELGAALMQVPKGVKVIVVLDCCHSGTGLRNSFEDRYADGFANRFLPPPVSNVLSNPLVDIDDDLNFVLPSVDKGIIQTQKRGVMHHTIDQGDIVLITGCQENQTSADAYIAGRYQGALTYYLVQALAKNSYKMSYRDLISATNKSMDQQRFQQNPQLEGKQRYFDVDFLG